MNRLIKFRAWIAKYEYMIYSGQHKELDGFTFNNDGTIIIHEGDGDQEYNSEDTLLMQFTGLFDVDGEMIWEGDICIKERTGLKCLIVFNQGAWAIKYESNRGVFIQEFCNGANSKYLKVIGNIHQNKELLIELTSKK